MSGFNPDSATAIIDFLEELFPDDEMNAAMHICAVLLGLSADDDDARQTLEIVIQLKQS